MTIIRSRPRWRTGPLRLVAAADCDRPQKLDCTDARQPAAARVRNYALGDQLHGAADRALWRRVLRVYPEAQRVAVAHQRFVGRAVQHLIEAGTRQFLHVGSGLPTYGSAHEIAGDLALDLGVGLGVRVVYADPDPLVAEHGKALLAGCPRTRMVAANPRHPAGIVYDPQVMDFLDFAEPVAVLITASPPMPAVPQLLTTGLRELADALVAGSHLVITNLGPEPCHHRKDHQQQAVRVLAAAGMAAPIRSREQLIAQLEHTGFAPLSPGVATADAWLPDPDDADLPPAPAALAVIAGRHAEPAPGPSRSDTSPKIRNADDSLPVNCLHLALCRSQSEPRPCCRRQRPDLTAAC